MTEIQSALFALEDKTYKEFIAKLVPTVKLGRIIGIRTPQLRRFALDFAGSDAAEAFLESLPHHYYEENNLHSFLIERTKDYALCEKRLEAFLSYVDNWATCDSMNPTCFKRNTDKALPTALRRVESPQTYVRRFGMLTLMRYGLEAETFKAEYLDAVARVESEEYYVRMMQAWFFATALAKQYSATLPVLKERRLDAWTHNKTIQKARESFRITQEQKTELLGLKVKPNTKKA